MNLFLVIIHWLIPKAYASPITDYCQALHPGCGSGRYFIIDLANGVVNFLSTIVGGAAVLALIWGAIRILSSGGNDEGKNQGKTIIIAALAGLVLALAGKTFVYFVAEFVEMYSSDLGV